MSSRDANIIAKCKKVIESCETNAQRITAMKYLKLAAKSVDNVMSCYDILDLTYHKGLDTVHV